MGQNILWFQCDITFNDFKQLLAGESSLETIEPVVKELLGCSIERTELGVKLIAADGSFIPLEVAHLQLQFNPQAQALIYNAAMNLWR
jgi:hypothetical protein